MGHSRSHRARIKMKSLLVCFALVAVAFGEEEKAAEAPKAVLPLAYGLPYAYHHPLTYTIPAIQPIQYKYVPKEVEIEVKSYQPEVQETGCVNSFGTPVPCRARRDADEEEAAPAAPAVEAPYYYAPSIYSGYLGAPLVHAAPVAPALTYAHAVRPFAHLIP